MERITVEQIRKFKLVAQEREIQELKELLRLKTLDCQAMTENWKEAAGQLAPLTQENRILKSKNRKLILWVAVEFVLILALGVVVRVMWSR
jgi:hypothetical protein